MACKYKLSKTLTSDKLLNANFKYNGNEYVNTYPIEFYIANKKRVPMIFIKFEIQFNRDNRDYHYTIIKRDGSTYSTYYNTRFGNAQKYIKLLDNKIESVFKKLVSYDILMDKEKNKNKQKNKINQNTIINKKKRNKEHGNN